MIKFLDLQSQYQSIKKEIDSVVLEIMEKCAFVGGEYVERFEREFATEVGSKYALGVANGTEALELALRALDLKSGGEVILPANTFFGSLEGVVNAGLKPVFVDCGEDYCIDVSAIREAITSNTVAIMPVHLYGRVCEMKEILNLSREYDLKIVEDCAQSFGAKLRIDDELRLSGNIGDVGCFSFYPGKNLGAYGDGGMIITSDEGLYQRASSLANHGRGKDKYEHLCIGRNSRLDGIQAGILSVKLKYIQEWNERRRKCARLYCDLLEDMSEVLALPRIDEEERSVWHLFVLRLRGEWEGRREELMKYLKENEIECAIHYPHPLSDLYRAKKWSRDILSLPMGEHLNQEDIIEVVRVLKQF